MNLLSLPDGRIINLEHLTYAERAGEYLALHFDSGAEGGMGSVVRLKQGEGARRVWAYLAGKCTAKIEAVWFTARILLSSSGVAGGTEKFDNCTPRRTFGCGE